MPRPENPHLRQFLLFVFALIVPTFALWTVAADAIAMPVVGLADMILTAWFPDVVDGLVFRGGDVYLMTQFGELDGRPVPPEQSDFQLTYLINPAVVSYSLPFYTTLHFATQKEDYLSSYISGVLLLYPLMLVSLVTMCMKDMMFHLGTVFMEQPGVWLPHANVIAIAFQLSVLIVPTVAPIAVWAWQNRESDLFQSVLGDHVRDENEKQA
jgi:hypothetical protein